MIIETHGQTEQKEIFIQKKEIMWMMTMINRTYPESDWQTFKRTLKNPRFDFSANYQEQLPFRFSRSMLAPNLAGLIREGKKEKAAVEDLKRAGFSRQLQHDVRCLLGDVNVIEEFHGIKDGGENSDE